MIMNTIIVSTPRFWSALAVISDLLCGSGPVAACRCRWRGFGARRLAKWIHGYRDVLDIDDREALGLPGSLEEHGIAGAGLHQRARQRRATADVVAGEVDFVEADNANDVFAIRGVAIGHGRAEE